MKVNIWYSALEQKVSVFCAIYFPASSYPLLVFVQNNHGCLGGMHLYSIRPWVKLFWERDKEADQREWLDHYNLCKEWNYTIHP